MITAVRGRGLMIAFDLPIRTRDEFWRGLFDDGLLVCVGRALDPLPPVLDVTDDIMEEAMELHRARRMPAMLRLRCSRDAKLGLMYAIASSRNSACDDNPGVFDGAWRGGGAVHRKVLADRRQIVLPACARPRRDDYEQAIARAQEAFLKWRVMPAPVRGEIIRQLGNALRERKVRSRHARHARSGQDFAEGEGEVQEMIDICDFAVGLSRQLYGLTIPSERPSTA